MGSVRPRGILGECGPKGGKDEARTATQEEVLNQEEGLK